jgi:DNA-directed RNA polymerase specialized sigma24 family protein
MDSTKLFEILVRENADMLIAYIRSTARDDALADDIFQETMLTAWRRMANQFALVIPNPPSSTLVQLLQIGPNRFLEGPVLNRVGGGCLSLLAQVPTQAGRT